MNPVAWARELRREYAEVYRYRELLDSLVRRELQVRYKNSRVGVLWSLANPIVRALILTVVFKYIMPLGLDNYSAYLLAAFFPWTYFLTGVLDACDSVSRHMPLVKKVYFPRELLPLATTIANLKHFLLSLGVLGVYLVFLYAWASWTKGHLELPPAEILLLPLLVLMQTLLIGGLALYLSAMNVFFEDIKFLTAVVLDLMFYAVPIVYFLEQVQTTTAISDPTLRQIIHTLFLLNPMTVILTSYRSFLLSGKEVLPAGSFRLETELPINQGVPWPYFWLAFVVCIAVFLAGYTFFNRRKWRFVEQL
jgi:ABC-type polysaccharide/polyol phosphate export permease